LGAAAKTPFSYAHLVRARLVRTHRERPRCGGFTGGFRSSAAGWRSG